MTDQEYIKELEARLMHAAEQSRNQQTILAAIVSEHDALKGKFDGRITEKRDYFAAAALCGLLARRAASTWNDYAEDAYRAADAMLKAKEAQ